MEDKKQSKVIFAVLGVAILLTLTVGISFAIYSYDKVGGTNTISTGTISMSFTESTNVISLENALPVQNDTLAQNSTDYFQFTITSKTSSAMEVPYTVTLTELAVDSGYTKLGQSLIKVYLTEVDSADETETMKVDELVSGILGSQTSGTLLAGKHTHTTGNEMSTTYRLRLWIPYSVNASSWNSGTKFEYKVKIDVTGSV